MPLWLFGVFLFSRDAPKESNDVSTIPKQAADADNCSLECQATWAETAATPKPRKLRPGNKKGRTSLEAETALSLFGLKQPRIPSDLGRNSLDADTAPKQLGLASPRSSSCLANPPRTSCLRLHAYLVTCAFAYLLTYSLTYLLSRLRGEAPGRLSKTSSFGPHFRQALHAQSVLTCVLIYLLTYLIAYLLAY